MPADREPNLSDNDWNRLRYCWNGLRNDDDAEGAEIFVENERGNIVEERGYDYERDRVAEGKFVVGPP